MKNIKLILLLFLMMQNVFGQMDSVQNKRSFWSISPRLGYDIVPNYMNNTPYIDYEGGILLGVSVDKYWNWFGLGVDFDYIQNQPKNLYPMSGFIGSNGVSTNDFSLSEERISRIFYGIGPNFKYQSSGNKFIAELNTRFGMSQIKGGRTLLTETTLDSLNFHAGYNDNVFSAKGQLKFTYQINPNFGVFIGGYYMHHFGVKDLNENGVYAYYKNYSLSEDGFIILDELKMIRNEACNCDISSIGAFAGVSFKLYSKPKQKIEKQYCNVCGQTHELPLCECLTCPASDKFGLAITAKDKYSGELLPQTSIALKNSMGEIIKTGVTNEFGVVTFDEIIPENYSIEGILYSVNLESSTIQKDDFISNEIVQRQILYTDANFIIKGKAFECNTNIALNGTSVYLDGVNENYTKTTMTNELGEFILHLPKLGLYRLYGKKNGFMSNIEEVSALSYNRERSLFVQLEICAQEVNCKTIRLENIHYDRDKFFIRQDAHSELNKVIQFLRDNPSVKIEILSHTDSRASNTYNQTLSQNRAQAAIDYIASNGIDRSRLVGIGYGETKLLNGCSDNVVCSEADHQLNRRTEMRVLCP